MKATKNFFIQGLILSLTTQLAWTLAVEKESPSSQGIVGALYRSAALKSVSGEKEATDVAAGSSRGQRCVRCGANGGYYGNYGNYADRYDGGYYYNRDYNRGSYYGREDPQQSYYGRDQYGRDPYGRDNPRGGDRNWYYQQDGRYYDSRYPYDTKNYYNKYDDRYYARNNPYESDPYYSQYGNNYNNNYNSYRGNGYDNLNPSYYEAMRDRFQRDRSYGYDQYYDRYNDRPTYRGYYDNRNFRPYDETYSGTAGYDLSGRGYYFANDLANRPDPPLPPPPPPRQPNFYGQAQKPQAIPPNDIYHQHSPHHTTPSLIPPEFYQGKPARPPSSSSSSSPTHTQTISSNTIGVDSGGSATSVDRNNNNNNNNSNKELDNKDKASTTYGSRPQNLGSSYLFERTDEESNAGSGLSPPGVNGDKKQESANMEMKSE